MGQEGSRKTREKGGFPGGGNIMLRAKGTFPYGRREYHASNKGKAVFLEHKNALGTSNALFYFLGRGGGWAAVKLVLQLFTHLPPPQVLPSGKTC